VDCQVAEFLLDLDDVKIGERAGWQDSDRCFEPIEKSREDRLPAPEAFEPDRSRHRISEGKGSLPDASVPFGGALRSHVAHLGPAFQPILTAPPRTSELEKGILSTVLRLLERPTAFLVCRFGSSASVAASGRPSPEREPKSNPGFVGLQEVTVGMTMQATVRHFFTPLPVQACASNRYPYFIAPKPAGLSSVAAVRFLERPT
jgi:hypothetical protein